jgi:hypothetical protein
LRAAARTQASIVGSYGKGSSASPLGQFELYSHPIATSNPTKSLALRELTTHLARPTVG